MLQTIHPKRMTLVFVMVVSRDTDTVTALDTNLLYSRKMYQASPVVQFC